MPQAYSDSIYNHAIPKAVQNCELLIRMEHEPLGRVGDCKRRFGEIPLEETPYHSTFFEDATSFLHIFYSVRVRTKHRVSLAVCCGAENVSVIGQDITAAMVYLPTRIRLFR